VNKMKQISAIVNARLSSSRMQSKMIRQFCGTDLLEIAVEKLDKLDYFSHRFLAVAEEELMEKAKKYKNVEILKRKKESVAPGPHHPLVTFEHYTRVPTEYFFVINSCSVFLSLDTIKLAYDIFQQTNYKAYISAVETRDWIFNQVGKPLTHTDPDAYQNTSDGKIFFRATHAFYIANRDYFSQNNGKLWNLKINDPYLIQMPMEESLDIDTDFDFEVSQSLYMDRIRKKDNAIV
jgi:CMP-N-acetylneuraminic acid synthetase